MTVPLVAVQKISIHAARVGCDPQCQIYRRPPSYFNPRSPSGLRLISELYRRRQKIFQSTQPEWAATDGRDGTKKYYTISIHAARVGCDPKAQQKADAPAISIHAARVGCDDYAGIHVNTLKNFNPRSPSGLRQNLVDGVARCR